ncbi:hypothetical protein AVEN_30736-1 [Araneus ventricosus]|uniref:Transposase Tc1-like domain-containing protein n=1 Tax=Araneus ventricosus TaxID=182803 RepID=A0A4Y2KSZ9_ARAVE|nr:hypothetical protein AVEN_30736-1 [Araneus ventricosus]
MDGQKSGLVWSASTSFERSGSPAASTLCTRFSPLGFSIIRTSKEIFGGNMLCGSEEFTKTPFWNTSSNLTNSSAMKGYSNEIIRRLECGRTQLEVSEELGIAQSIISRLWQRFQDDGNVSRCYNTGRPRVTTPNEDRYLAVTAKRNRRSTASDLSRQLSSATGTTVSRQTVYRRLGHIGLYARRPVRCVPLTATHCRLRLAWSREHALWTPQQWSCVMFSDESRFSLQSDSRPGLSYGERQVPVTTKRTPLNDTVTVVQDGSFGE